MKKFEHFELLVIGGGASGLGVALDGASRGVKTLLLERNDFGKATSSRSTKLIHGGVRYLRKGEISLVRESLRERGRLLRNAPDIVTPLPIVLPTESWFQTSFMAFGLWLYDRLAGTLNLDRSRRISKTELEALLPTITKGKFHGAVVYTDGQFDDAGLILAMLRSLKEHDGQAHNYTAVTDLIKTNGTLSGVRARDTETGEEFDITADHIVNATGIFTDHIRQMDDPTAPARLVPSRGSHLVLPARFLPGDHAMLIPKTPDGRLMFVIPWQGVVLAGTTDHRVDAPVAEPGVPDAEVDEILNTLAPYLTEAPTRADVISKFAGLRPLVSKPSKSGKPKASSTSALSRSHVIEQSPSGLISLMGGKWTTTRQMAEETVDRITDRPCATRDLKLAHRVPFDPHAPQSLKEAIEIEQARTLEDLLARRCRLLLHNASDALNVAQTLAPQLAQARGKPPEWAEEQLAQFTQLAKAYGA